MDGFVSSIDDKMKTIVVSAVNLRKGGTLAILRNCLEYLSGLAVKGDYRIVALLHKKELAYYPHIEYIEIPWAMRNWGLRLWCEYVTMYSISQKLQPVYLWLSLHDTTPRVKAEKQAVYCQTAFPFLHWNWQDLRFDYKIVLFALFTKFAYRVNMKRNFMFIVQAKWLRIDFSHLFCLPEKKFIVSPPKQKKEVIRENVYKKKCYLFVFASTPDCHKNIELICKATELLEKEIGKNKFQVLLSISGKENRYARWLYRQWGNIDSLKFVGFMSREKLYETYAQTDCLVFPSRIETWGLPISEFAAFDKPMLLADLPYAHETAAGSKLTAFFKPENVNELKEQMKRLVNGDTSFLKSIPDMVIEKPVARNWAELFDLLLK